MLICYIISIIIPMFLEWKNWPRKRTLRTFTFNQKVSPIFTLSTVNFLDGQVYFVRANTIGSDFGFPRLGIKKRYKWKKMNFTTDLPKRNPLVSYIVASAVRCEKFFPGGSKNGPVFRMHAVILKLRPGQTPGMVPQNPFNGEKTDRKPLYICCHVRKVEPNDEEADDIIVDESFEKRANVNSKTQKPQER